MRMPVMNVGVVRMAVRDGMVDVWMDVRFHSVPGERMLVPVVFIVGMGVRMLDRLVRMLVSMVLGYVEPHAQSHERGGCHQR